MHGGVMRRRERAFQVHLDDRVPIGFFHIDQHAVAQDAGIVDEHVEPAEGGDCMLHQPPRALPMADILAIGDGLATGGLDLGDDGLRRRVIGAAPVAAGADIADDDLCALGGELQRVFASNAARRPGDDGHPALA